MVPKPIDIDSVMMFVTGKNKIHRRYVTPGAERNTSIDEPSPVHVRDARPIQNEIKLDTYGFQLIHHESKMKDFTDLEAAEKMYLPELEDVVKNTIGADHVIAWSPIIRRASSVKRDGDQPVANSVHVDFTTRWASELGTKFLGSDWTKQYSRLLVVSSWRCFSPSPQDWPLAVMDSRSLGDEEGIINTLVYQDQLPDFDNLPPLLEGETCKVVGEGTIFPHKESQQWWYFSHMNRDELLILKLNDSDKGRAWRAPHSAFPNTAEKEVVPRESIEVRMCCYFK